MRTERGAFLLFFCTFLTLLLLVSLAVLDISVQRTEKDRKQQEIKLATLAAIDAYYKAFDKHEDEQGNSYDCSVDNQPCIDAAVTAANALLLTSDVDHAVFDSMEKIDELNYYDVPTSSDGAHYSHNEIKADTSNSVIDENQDMHLEVGYWVNCKNRIEKGLCSCRGTCQNFKKPNEGDEFFLNKAEYTQEFSGRITSEDDVEGINISMGNPNAIRIGGKWLQDSKTYALSKLLSGGNRIAPKMEAVAMVVPRHVYFVVDISDSGENDTFKGNAKAGYVQCNRGIACNRGIVTDLYYSIDDNGKRPDYPSNKEGYYTDDYVRKVVLGDADYNDLDEKEKKLHPDPTKYKMYSMQHCDSAGVCRGVWNGGAMRNAFLIHAFNPDGNNFPRPEPLTTIIRGVHKAIGTLRDRKITGDKAGVIFFTNGLYWPRITYLTDDIDALYRFTDYEGELDSTTGKVLFDDAIEGGNLASLSHPIDQLLNYEGQSGLDRAIRFSIFPVPFMRDGNKNDSWGYTNISEALRFAVRNMDAGELGKDDSDTEKYEYELDPNISRSIVLFSDGIQNCIPNTSGEDLVYDCNNKVFDYYRDGMSDIEKVVSGDGESMKNRNIALHVFQAGDYVGPHNVARKINSNSDNDVERCYTDVECRASKTCNSNIFVVGNPADDSANGQENSYNNMDSHPFYTASYNMYKMALDTGGVYVPLRKIDQTACAKECGIGEKCPEFNCSSYVEGERILTDPHCRSIERQIEDGMDEAIGVNPYRIVDVH